MAYRPPGVISRLIGWVSRPAGAAVLVSVVTLALVGGVVLTTTSLGCGPAEKLGLKGVTSHCKTVAGLTLTSPSPTTSPPYATFSPPSISPEPTQAQTPTPPYSPPASSPIPPTGGPASGAYPPFAPPASGSSGTATFSMNCRLPVYNGPPGSGGFIVFPGGTYVGDPASAVVIPSPSPGGPSPTPPGYGGPGYSGLSYDRGYRRWLPVPFTQVSSDGVRYAHVSPDSIYIENIATGATAELGQGHSWSLVGVEDKGVYASILNQPGLWFLPYSGTAIQITTTGYWQTESNAAAYGTRESAVPQGVANTIIRLDLKTHAISDWFKREGASSSVFGFDYFGNPLIYVYYFQPGGASEVWLTTAPNAGTPLFGSSQGLSSYSTPLADSWGIWFVMSYNVPYGISAQGLALYVPSKGQLYWMSSLGTQLAGGCA